MYPEELAMQHLAYLNKSKTLTDMRLIQRHYLQTFGAQP